MQHWSRPLCFSVLVALTATLAPSLAHAGGWTQPQGEFYLKLWDRTLLGSQAFLADGEIEPVEPFQDHLLHVYAEYGLTDDWTAVLFSTPLGYADYDGNSALYSGLTFAGVRRSLLKGSVPLAIEAHYGYAPPLGDKNLGPADVDYVYTPTVSTHRIDGELQVGYGLPSGWATASVGGRWSSAAEIDPALYANAQIGYSTSFGLVADLHAGLLFPFGDIEQTNVAGAGQTEYLGLGIGLSYWITERFGVHLAGEGVAYARSNAATPSLLLGVEMK